MNKLLLVLLPLTGCLSDEIDDDVDDAISEDDAGKADEVQAYKHYLVTAGEVGDNGTGAWLARAGGGKLRCPNDVVSDRCEINAWDLVPTLGFTTPPEVVVDELADHPVIIRGRLVRTNDRVYLRASTLTRGLTSVVPTSPCYRLTPSGNRNKLAKLDAAATVRTADVTYFDDVDPTPDFWGQPTPAVQAKIDAALALAPTRPVYVCGWMDQRDPQLLFWTMQMFAPYAPGP